MGWVTAGKLLARKRPRLIPVYDRVVRCALGRPAKPWRWLNDAFALDAEALPGRRAATGRSSVCGLQASVCGGRLVAPDLSRPVAIRIAPVHAGS